LSALPVSVQAESGREPIGKFATDRWSGYWTNRQVRLRPMSAVDPKGIIEADKRHRGR
jgi:hypothetical protein